MVPQVCTDAALAVALASAAQPAPNAVRPTPARAARAVAMQFGKVQCRDTTATTAYCAHAYQLLRDTRPAVHPPVNS